VKVDLPKLKKSVSAAAAAAGYGPTQWFETSVEEEGQRQTRDAIAKGCTFVMAAGGDGTVRAVAEALRGTGLPLGLIPSGTGNLLARNLDMTVTDLEASVTTAFTGADRAIDMGVSEITRDDGSTSEHSFLVMAGLGLDAKMIALTNSKLKKAVGWLAYVDAGIRAIPELKPVRLHYKVNRGAIRSMSVHTIIIGNCGALPGGILLMPDAQPDDGLFDIAALRPRGPFGWVKVWNKITWENGVLRKSALGRKIIDLSRDVRDVTYFTARELDIVVEEPQQIQLDGDEFGEAKRARTWVDPASLVVRVPAGSLG
jgi:diacylglycerol kinase family enzyme